jgi:DNA uptake protein ComE-like DNA-binding protein
MDQHLVLDFNNTFAEVTQKVKLLYKFTWIRSPNDLIETYILRTPVTKVSTLQFPQTLTIQELEGYGIIFLSPDIEREDHFVIDFPYVWLKILVNLCEDNTLRTLFGSIFSILENDISGRDFEKLNHCLLTIKIYFHILKGKKTFSLKTVYRGAHFIDPTFDLEFDAPSAIKSVELEHQYPKTKQTIEENVIYLNVCNASFADIFYKSIPSDLFEQEKYSLKNENISSMISAEYSKVEKHLVKGKHFAFVYVGNGVVDLYPSYKNCVIISEKELTKYYGMAFAPRLAINIEKIDISLATETQLCEVKGLGKKSVQKIIAFRKKNKSKCTISNIQACIGFNDSEMKTLQDYLIFVKDIGDSK